MPAVYEVTSEQVDAIESGGYAGQVRFAVCPRVVVFQAEVDETITGSVFFSFGWDNATVGAYTDVNPGQTFYITETDDPDELRTPLFQGRVTQSPSATVFYCNEASFNLLQGYIVTVMDAYEILQKPRSGALVDGYLTFQKVPPCIKNMEVFYYVEDDTEGTFEFNPVGQAMEQGATIDSYHWTIPGAVYDTGDADTQNIVVTVPAGHRWAFLDVTDSNDVVQRLIFEILVCDRDDTDFMFMAHDAVQLNSELETGLNVSTTFFDGVENLLNRTRCAILAFDDYRDGTPGFSRIMFVGYIIQENTDVTGDERSSTLSQTQFELQSFAAIAAQLPVPSLAIRNVASPSAWEQINLPTTQRTAWHIIARYTTLGELCPIDWLFTDSTWFGDEMDLEATTLLESVNRIAEEIQARLVFFPQGDAALEINANALSEADRNALPGLLASGSITNSHLFNYKLPVPYYRTVGQLQVGFASFQTGGAVAFKLDALAPAVAHGEGNETPIIPAQLLPSDLTQAESIEEAKRRIGDLFEYLNPPTVLPLTFHDGWRFLTVSSRVWLTFDLPATENTRGIPITGDERWLLLSLSMRWDPRGTWDITGTARKESFGGLAQVSATISPNTIETPVPVLPAQSDYDAYPPDGTLNYLTNDPAEAARQPYSGYTLSQFNPMPTEDAANSADNQPGPNCCIIRPALNFKSSATRTTPRSTGVGELYAVTVKGFAQIATDGWQSHRNLVNAQDDFVPVSPFGTWTSGTGFVPGNGSIPGPAFIRAVFIQQTIPATTLTSVKVTFTLTKGSYSAVTPVAAIFLNGSLVASVNPADITDGVNKTLTWSGSMAGVTQIGLQITTSYQLSAVYSGDCAITSMDAAGSGTDPYTGEPGGNVFGDAFYQWVGEDGAAELYPSNRGLRVNSAALSVPPEYNENHEYTFLYTGDGNQTPFRYELEDYSGAQNKALYMRVCGANMGT